MTYPVQGLKHWLPSPIHCENANSPIVEIHSSKSGENATGICNKKKRKACKTNLSGPRPIAVQSNALIIDLCVTTKMVSPYEIEASDFKIALNLTNWGNN